MNGRVYDANLGRFISADPHIQNPLNSQSLNRYSYVMNNPLSFTDPSGFFFKKLFRSIKKLVKGIVKAVKNVIKNPRSILAIAATFIPGLNVYAAGFISGMIASGGDLKAGIIGALTAGAFKGVGDHFQGVARLNSAMNGAASRALTFGEQIAKVGAHAIVGGVSSAVQGGKFVHGFLSAGVTQGFSKAINGFKTAPGRIIAAAVVGGSASALGGGKFANGAVTGAFSRAFNDEEHFDSEVSEPDNSNFNQCVDAITACAAEQFGIQTGVGSALTVAGSETISKPFQMGNASRGTSFASKYLSKLFPRRLKFQIRTPRIGHLRSATPVVGRALGRFVPIVGQGILAYDAAKIGMCAIPSCTGSQ